MEASSPDLCYSAGCNINKPMLAMPLEIGLHVKKSREGDPHLSTDTWTAYHYDRQFNCEQYGHSP
jgi:hypothetical protein